MKRTPPGSPGRHKQNSLDGTNIAGITTQEAIVERAKQVCTFWIRFYTLPYFFGYKTGF